MRSMLAAAALMAATDGAYATTVAVNCAMSGPGALAAQFSSGGTENTEYRVTGPCNGGFEITQDNINIIPPIMIGAQTINGTVFITGANNINLLDLTINGSNNQPAVLVKGPARVTISPIGFTSTIQSAGRDGVLADGLALVQINNTTVQNNGGAGLHARGGAVIEAGSVTITGNGGIGVLAEQSSAVRLVNSTVTGPSNNHTVLVAQASSAILNGSTVTADTPFSGTNPLAVITAIGSSSVALAGGNTITNTASPGAAVIVSDGSSFIDVDGTRFGFASGPDTISGDGRIFTQSVMELATASGVGVDWTGNISAFAASSFRTDGGSVTVNGTVTLDQAANGYFNHQNGMTNNITSVVCKSTTDHVTNPTFVTPNVTIGSPLDCALFRDKNGAPPSVGSRKMACRGARRTGPRRGQGRRSGPYCR